MVPVGAVNHEFLRADAYDVARIVPRPVDFVLMANTLHGELDKTALRAIAAILRPDGFVTRARSSFRPITTVPSSRNRGSAARDLRTTCR